MTVNDGSYNTISQFSLILEQKLSNFLSPQVSMMVDAKPRLLLGRNHTTKPLAGGEGYTANANLKMHFDIFSFKSAAAHFYAKKHYHK